MREEDEEEQQQQRPEESSLVTAISSSPEEPIAGRAELFLFLNQILLQVEEQSGSTEPELRDKITALHAETVEMPRPSARQWSEFEIALELDRLSKRLDSVSQMVSSAAADPEVQGLLSATADLWLPAITATTDERYASASAAELTLREKGS